MAEVGGRRMVVVVLQFSYMVPRSSFIMGTDNIFSIDSKHILQ